jgi:hypothetical protein
VDGRPSVAPSLWYDNYRIYFLQQKMRCPDDFDFASLCDRAGKGPHYLTDADETFLKSRITEGPIEAEKRNDNFKCGNIAIIVTTNEMKDGINLSKLRKLLPHEDEHVCLALDKITNANMFTPEQVSFNEKNVMMKNLIIRNGAPVVITINHKTPRYKEDGITNGSRGFIDYIQTNSKGVVNIIWVIFNDKTIGRKCYKRENAKYRPAEGNYVDDKALPIFPTSKTCHGVKQTGVQYERYQFAMSLAYAITAHKCQGQTLDEVIIDFRTIENKKPFIQPGSFYVAITRVTKASKLWLRSFDRTMIMTHKLVEPTINTMKLQYRYKMKKIYIDEEIFTKDGVKVGYLNINGLLPGKHAEYVNGDHNLQHLDLLVLSETHLTKVNLNVTIQNKMTNWTMLKRFDAKDGKAHMGLLLLRSNKSKKWADLNISETSTGTTQSLTCKIEGHTFSFIYCRQTPNHKEVKCIFDFTDKSEFLMGDLNLNPNNLDDKHKLKIVCGTRKKVLLKEITTKNRAQLDHILGVVKENYEVYVTSYKNFASDHHTIVTRISDLRAQFIQDDRL